MADQRKRKALRNEALIQLNKDLQKEIADLRVIENRLQATNDLLNLFLKKSSRHEYLEALVNLLYQWSECRGIGIRLIDSQGNIPYEAYRGFSSAFWKSENCLSLLNDQCLCSRIIQEKPALEETPFLTKAGSFCSNDLSSFMARISSASLDKYRGVCARIGFDSLAIIPIRHKKEVLGAIHLADERPGCISIALVEFIETMAPLIAETINRFNLEDELKTSAERLRFISGQLLTAQENERKRIARELHDSIGQSLAAIKFVLEKKISELNSTANCPGIRLEEIVPMIQNMMEEIRCVSMDLWPSILDDLGLLSGINYFCRQFGEIYSTIKIDKDLSVAEDAVPSSLKIVIYRILQEGLNNIAKYSKADKVLISLHKKNKHLELAIADNGIGFDYQTFPKGMGLVGMKERVELSGGYFTLISLPGKGTTIKATWFIS